MYAEKDKKERRMSSTPTPCAACKFLRRKCTPECIFAPYFPANNPERFECVHRVFGASNVGKILNELPPSQREDAVKSLAFQAKARLRNPVYGCTFQVSILQQLLRQRRAVLENAKRELSAYINPQAIQGPFNPQEKPLSSSPAHLGPSCCSNIVQYSAHLNPFYDPNVVHSSVHLGLSDGPDDEPFFKPAIQYNGSLGGGGAVPQADPGQQELLEAQQLAAAVAFREQQLRYNAAAGIEPVAAAAPYGGNVSGSGVFGHMGAPSGGQGGEMAPCMGLGTFDSGESYHSQLQQPPQHGVGGNYVLATQHHYPLEGQLLLPSEHQALPLTLQQQQQLELQVLQQQLELQLLQQQQQLELQLLQQQQEQQQLQQLSESEDSKSVGPS
ncbi:LOB domain-containing protein 6-like isoform X1 [Arachis ipaensis]|nr:LOB domain-containing protein 6-like isoform X1 [Arachis ipaensis]XP_025627928.2 LOB domain-containing protein 6-like [Arachis hypogaea]